MKEKDKKVVLVIDDEEDLRETITYLFTAKGFRVVTACDGLDGLDKLKTISPDLIILDMNMPRMGGLEFFGRLKDEKETSQYPVLVLTARANMEQLFRDIDVDGFMSKPFDLQKLLHEAQAIIRKNAACVSGENRRARHICIVENDLSVFNPLALAFLESGYLVNLAHSGASAIKYISRNKPDAVVIKVGLADIQGDVVLLKLKEVEDLKGVKTILYNADGGVDYRITEKIKSKEGIDAYVESNSSEALLNAVESQFQS